MMGWGKWRTSVTNELRKAEPRLRLRAAHHPRRSSAPFTEENDHNPIVLQNCPACRGTGKVCRHLKMKDRECIRREACSSCAGTGITGELEHFFTNDSPEMTAECRSEG